MTSSTWLMKRILIAGFAFYLASVYLVMKGYQHLFTSKNIDTSSTVASIPKITSGSLPKTLPITIPNVQPMIVVNNEPIKFNFQQCAAKKKYIGRHEYGGWMMCPIGLNSDSVVYSFGIGENAEFDHEMINEFNLHALYAFDPTPKSVEYVTKQKNSGFLDDRFQLHTMALIGDSELTQMKMHLPKNSNHVSGSVVSSSDHLDPSNFVTVDALDLPRIMKKLNHDHIDLLKIDIEGAEFDVLKRLLSDGKFNYCNQVLVEQHARFFGNEGQQKLKEMIHLFRKNGFRLIHVEKGEEYTWVRA
jgi:FkbM family methyltransferase